MKLSQDYKEQIREIIEAEQWPAVMALIEMQVAKQERAVVDCDLNKGPRMLFEQRARLEGARAVRVALAGVKDAFKEK